LEAHGQRILSWWLDGKEVPWLGHALEGVNPPILEPDPRARHQILHGRGDDHLTGGGKRGQAGGDGHRDPAHIVAEQLDLAGVQAGPDLQAQRRDRPLDGADAADRPSRAVEGGQAAVADVAAADLGAAGLANLARR
jgi:hypothetical protein